MPMKALENWSSFHHNGANLAYTIRTGSPDNVHYDKMTPIMLFAPEMLDSQVCLVLNQQCVRLCVIGEHNVIIQDQRNSNRKARAPITEDYGWQTYTADHLALMNHLGIPKCHLLGDRIGCSFALAFMKAHPERVASAILLNPIGFDPKTDNRKAIFDKFDEWAQDCARHADKATLEKVKQRMFGGDFVFSVSEDDVARMDIPMMIKGNRDEELTPPAIRERLYDLAKKKTKAEYNLFGEDELVFIAKHHEFTGGQKAGVSTTAICLGLAGAVLAAAYFRFRGSK